MISFLSGLFATSWNLISYSMALAWYAWMCVPFVGGAYFIYRFFSLYSSTSLEAYRHTKIEGEVAQRSVQAAMEMVDWIASCLTTLQMVKLANTMIRLRFGISQVRQAPPATRTDRTNTVQAAMAQSIRSLGNSVVSGGNRLTFGTVNGKTPTFGAITRDPLSSSSPPSNNNEEKTNDQETPPGSHED